MAEPMLLHLDRIKFLLEGAVQSDSEPDRIHQPRILLNANLLCTCAGNQMNDDVCKHLVALLNGLDKQELVKFILEAQQVPDPITPEE